MVGLSELLDFAETGERQGKVVWPCALRHAPFQAG